MADPSPLAFAGFGVGPEISQAVVPSIALRSAVPFLKRAALNTVDTGSESSSLFGSCSSVAPLAAAIVSAGFVVVKAGRRSKRRGGHITRLASEVSDARPATAAAHKDRRKPKLVVLGSGWGAATFMKNLPDADAQKYDITLVSPRNHFLYTPLLPNTTVGSVEDRSICTPIRKLLAGKADYLEATCTNIDTVKQKLHCAILGDPGNPADLNIDRNAPKEDVQKKLNFSLDYDILVYAVGTQANDFGIPGVKENAFFFKEIADSQRVRQRISDCFERASLPFISEEQRKILLSFVIVGGGPTGVEVAADLADFIQGEAAELYPRLIDDVKVQLVSTGDGVLATYSDKISRASLNVFENSGVTVYKGRRVIEVTYDSVKMKIKATGEQVTVRHGLCVWAAGIRENPLTNQLKASLVDRNEAFAKEADIPDQQRAYREHRVGVLKTKMNGLVTDELLQVRGTQGTIFALGDASSVRNDTTYEEAEDLFSQADADNNGKLDMYELRELLQNKRSAFPQMGEYAGVLDTVVNKHQKGESNPVANFFGGASSSVSRALKGVDEFFNQRVSDRYAARGKEAIISDLSSVDVDASGDLDLGEFMELLKRMDTNLRCFPATAQVAAQQGSYLAKLFAKGKLDGTIEGLEASEGEPFTYFHKGSLAYLGNNEAAFDVPLVGPLTGPLAGIAWKAYETSAQMTSKNSAAVGADWLRSAAWGRDTSRFH